MQKNARVEPRRDEPSLEDYDGILGVYKLSGTTKPPGRPIRLKGQRGPVDREFAATFDHPDARTDREDHRQVTLSYFWQILLHPPKLPAGPVASESVTLALRANRVLQVIDQSGSQLTSRLRARGMG